MERLRRFRRTAGRARTIGFAAALAILFILIVLGDTLVLLPASLVTFAATYFARTFFFSRMHVINQILQSLVAIYIVLAILNIFVLPDIVPGYVLIVLGMAIIGCYFWVVSDNDFWMHVHRARVRESKERTDSSDSSVMVERAISLAGEAPILKEMVDDLTNIPAKLAYAEWLERQGDSRAAVLRDCITAMQEPGWPLPDSSDCPEVWRNVTGIALLEALAEQKLFANRDAILRLARPTVEIQTNLATKADFPIGASRFGGRPDLPPNIAWPEYSSRLHTFLGQINLGDLAETMVGFELPQTGILSFFVYNDVEETGHPANLGAEGAWKVLYFPDVSGLSRRKPPKKFSEGNSLGPPCRLYLTETLDLPYVSSSHEEGTLHLQEIGLDEQQLDGYWQVKVALRSDAYGSHILGYGQPLVIAGDPVPQGFRHLITFKSDENLEWCWADDHLLYFVIKPEDLAAHRFDATGILDG